MKPVKATSTAGRILSCLVLGALSMVVAAADVGPHLVIYPAAVRTHPGAMVQFSAVHYTATGQRRAPSGVRWWAGGGEVAPDGTYRAGAVPGTYRVQAVADGLRAAATVVIVAAASPATSPARIRVTPAVARLQVGDAVRFQALVYDAAGRRLYSTPQWRAEEGRIDEQGMYIATTPGRYTVSASAAAGKVIGTATVVVDPVPDRSR